MFSAIMVADETDLVGRLSSELAQKGFTCSIIPDVEDAMEQINEQRPDLIFIAMDGLSANSRISNLPQRVRQERPLPVIALASREAFHRLESAKGVDDFIVEPWDPAEVAVRAKRLLLRTNHVGSEELLKCGDLTIDLARCEVSVNGRLVLLTFKEYELLKFLASNKDRVFTRESLLNRVWGYDYYGGDRTVDVHIRRLRSKIEDSTHTFIETVRNVGYKFRNGV
ncbi:MAG: response regulator transcription factor [Chloroflexi bacterium]|nr:response regulator transcription factor [Chloroflexota bacterium]